MMFGAIRSQSGYVYRIQQVAAGAVALAARLRRALRPVAVILVLMMQLGGTPAAAETERRIALVIGNATYPGVTTLTNPVNDAKLMRQTLEKLGFEVIYRENADKSTMERAISVFTDKLFAAGSSGVALVYYAGHGLQSNGENYLLPTDINIVRESDLRFGAIRSSDVLAQMEAAQSQIKIVILDACRDNPFATRFGGGKSNRGLAETSLGNSEFFVAYAATAGNTADDGDGDGVNSPYAASLAKRLLMSGSEISNTFRLVRVDVSSATREKQLPETRTTMRREFYFAGAPANRPVDTAMAAPPQRLVLLTPEATNLIGRWCEAGRGRGVGLGIDDKNINYSVAGESTRFSVTAIRPLPDAKIALDWVNRGKQVTFEFGDFDSKGMMMTQIRGRSGPDGEWKDYNIRFRKCTT
jgi:hypothetical protein